MEAIVLLLVWCVSISVDCDVRSKGRKLSGRINIRIRIGFGTRHQASSQVDNGDE